ncbi:DUF4062 domain-containing protein [Jannaschia pohangensis]|uniref:DUF4062 domain-containing protein n=1 Tax=Jannaschia pohangensis TaxID=390807 RepID=UPI001FE22046|nr:DUF4062 domain-containing protein [Jannaschia pohangensis]
MSSPGNLGAERDIVKQVCSEVSRDIGVRAGFRLEPILWESHTYPGMAERSQQVITDQVGDYDIYLGVMGQYFGSDTGLYGSGTEEEFEDAIRLREDGQGPKVQFYFSVGNVELRSIDIKQYEKVLEFKRSIGVRGIFYREFEDLTAFSSVVRMALSADSQQIASAYSASIGVAEIEPTALTKDSQDSPNLSSLMARSDGIAAQYLIIQAVKSFDRHTAGFNKLSSLTEVFSKSIIKFNREASRVSSGKNKSTTQVAKSFEALLKMLERQIVEFPEISGEMEESVSEAFSLFQRAALILSASKNLKADEMADVLAAMDGFLGALVSVKEAVNLAEGQMLEALTISDELPRLTYGGQIYSAILKDFVIFMDRTILTVSSSIDEFRNLQSD